MRDQIPLTYNFDNADIENVAGWIRLANTEIETPEDFAKLIDLVEAEFPPDEPIGKFSGYFDRKIKELGLENNERLKLFYQQWYRGRDFSEAGIKRDKTDGHYIE